VYARASWGAAVLRPYMDLARGERKGGVANVRAAWRT
jgi:hypothetical protein